MMGDLLVKIPDLGGLGWGTTMTSAVFLATLSPSSCTWRPQEGGSIETRFRASSCGSLALSVEKPKRSTFTTHGFSYFCRAGNLCDDRRREHGDCRDSRSDEKVQPGRHERVRWRVEDAG